MEIFTQVPPSSTHAIIFLNPQKSLKYCKTTQKSKTVHRKPCLNLSEMSRGWNMQNVLKSSPSSTHFSWLQGSFHAISLELILRSCPYLLETHLRSALQQALTKQVMGKNKCPLYMSISLVALRCAISQSLLIPKIRKFWKMDPKHSICSPFIKDFFVKHYQVTWE